MKLPILYMLLITMTLISCNKNEGEVEMNQPISKEHKLINQKLKAYAIVEFTDDNIALSHLSAREKKMVAKLLEAGNYADELFWKQSSHDALLVRDSLLKEDTQEAKDFLRYVNINYGPYDVIFDQERFIGNGEKIRPLGGGFYPTDMTKEEFEQAIKDNPKLENSFRNQYTVIIREGKELKATPYSKYYQEIDKIATKLEEASQYCDNESLKKYLILRAKDLRNDNYYQSDLAWMDLKDNNIDIVIGPIENYEDEIFNYKTAFECVIMVKDPKASKELDMFKDNMNYFQQNLPTNDEYKKDDLGLGNIIQVVNAIYFGGDCKKGTKTIAAALPNDPKVAEAKGRKLSMYINHMTAKFDKIVKPIAEELLAPEWAKLVDKNAFIGFVTLHEVGHALGTKYTKNKLDIRQALKERYSPIEECKADILSIYCHKLLMDKGVYKKDYIRKCQATYVAGLYRSIRFGTGAHCISNYIQLNYLQTNGAISFSNGKFTINENVFFDNIEELARMILDIEYNGDYQQAGKIFAIYGKETPEINQNIERLVKVPRDIDTYYNFKLN